MFDCWFHIWSHTLLDCDPDGVLYQECLASCLLGSEGERRLQRPGLHPAPCAPYSRWTSRRQGSVWDCVMSRFMGKTSCKWTLNDPMNALLGRVTFLCRNWKLSLHSVVLELTNQTTVRLPSWRHDGVGSRPQCSVLVMHLNAPVTAMNLKDMLNINSVCVCVCVGRCFVFRCVFWDHLYFSSSTDCVRVHVQSILNLLKPCNHVCSFWWLGIISHHYWIKTRRWLWSAEKAAVTFEHPHLCMWDHVLICVCVAFEVLGSELEG